MCGFVGFTNPPADGKEILQSMMDKITHRGPDSDGSYLDDKIAMGFRRLSIIDLVGGDQPLYNEDGTLVLTFNGEIYNFEELKQDLVGKGHTFSTYADSEVLVHGFEEYGQDILPRLRGMFAFVIWDKEKKRLFGARDYFGIKPFYYAQMGETFFFGSEIKAFLPHPGFVKELNEEALEQYLSFQYSVLNESFFKGVFKLPPAHFFFYRDGELDIQRYWEPKFTPEEDKDGAYWIDEIERVFDDSVKAHKVSDVEVGSFLSSGVDSSYAACSAHVDKTFTVGFAQHQYNEIDYAKDLSEKIGVKNISKVITAEEFWESFPKVQYQMDEPLADPSAVALNFVCQLAAEHVKVVLSGEGADEIFGGYNVYREPIEMTAYDKVPFAIRRVIGRIAECLPPHRGRNFLVRRGKTLEERFIGNAYMFTQKEREKLLKHPLKTASPEEICAPFYEKVKDSDPVTKMQYLDLHLWMTGDILLKADRMSMAHSLELRVPFLDKKVMELAQRIPMKHRVNAQNTKFVMRQAALRRMPKEVADKKKLGFPVPTRVWLKEEQYYQKVKDAFLSDTAEKFFHTDGLVHLLDRHRDGKEDNSRKIWTVYTFLIWYEQYFGQAEA